MTLTKKQLQQLQEKALREQVLVPLLAAMGYRDVKLTHGSQELGKDIVCWRPDEIAGRINLALVVKAIRLTGQVSSTKGRSATEVVMQVLQAFGSSFHDSATLKEQDVDECWVVTNREITAEAEKSIKAALHKSGQHGPVRYIDGERLWALVEKYLPVAVVWQRLEEAHQLLNDIDPHVFPEIRLTLAGVEVVWREKYPGAAVEIPFTGKLLFAVPLDTPEGQQFQAAMEDHEAIGTPVEIPTQFIKEFELPESVRQLWGDAEIQMIQLMSGPHPTPFIARVEVETKDGDSFALEYVEFRVMQVGTAGAMFSNEDQPSSIKVGMAVDERDMKNAITFGLSDKPLTVHQLLSWLQLRQCLGKEWRARVVPLNTGWSLFETQWTEAPNMDLPEPRFVQLMADLDAIQVRTKQLLIYPRQGLTNDERAIVAKLQAILHNGGFTAAWSGGVIPLPASEATSLLDKLAGGKAIWIRQRQDESEQLFGTDIPLGSVEQDYWVVLTNEEEVREKLAHAPEESTLIDMVFRSVNNVVIVRYTDWPVQFQPDPALIEPPHIQE